MRVLLVLLLFATLAAAQVSTDDAPSATVTVTVVDAAGKPAPGLTIAGLWGAGGYLGEGDRKRMVPIGPVWKTGTDGSVKVAIRGRRGPYVSASKVTALLTYDEKQEHAALAILVGAPASGKVTLKLGPVVTVRGKFACPELGRTPRWANNYLFGFSEDGKGSVRIAVAATPDGSFAFKLPPGRYAQHCFGEEVTLLRRTLDLDAEESEQDLGTVEFEASGIAKAYGKEPPLWWIQEARGVDLSVEPADYKGKWLLVIYWAWW
ncbi:MAG: hypothetical protein ACYTDY_17365 [Planctomycetota bacterium]